MTLEQKSYPNNTNIQRRFIIGVLLPPFIVLLVIGAVLYWQLNSFVLSKAVGDLRRSADTTAAKIEREFALRETVLKRTGEDLFTIKSNYLVSRQTLEKNRSGCIDYVRRFGTFLNAPDNHCDPFLSEFARLGTRTSAIEQGYVNRGQELIDSQNQQINARLSAFKQFFPETLALLVFDKSGDLVSSALSGGFNGSIDLFVDDAARAQTEPVVGQLRNFADFRMAVFSYPIENGSVLAAYDIDNPGFIRGSWETAPINQKEAVAIILDAEGETAYPNYGLAVNLKPVNDSLSKEEFVYTDLQNTRHIAVASEAGESEWLVVVASPSVVVLSPVRNAQLIAVIIIGSLLVGFLWVGTVFIKRTIRSILRLVAGTIVFAGGNLNYKITLDHADQEFHQLAETMNGMAARIAAAEKEIDEKNKEFISLATHELRTPLTAILGNLEMASDSMQDHPEENTKQFIDKAFDGTRRLRDLVNDMLDVARLEGNRQEFEIRPQDIKTIVGEVMESLGVTAKEKGIALSYDSKNARGVSADESRLRIVLNNFVSNAIKYNRPNGTVSVSHSLKGDMLVTEVADTGLGIPEAQKAHMFEKFFRVQDKDRKDIVGTGLGMYITKQYVVKMGGTVWFDSVHGKGTTFCFTLPLADNSPAA